MPHLALEESTNFPLPWWEEFRRREIAVLRAR
jgi:hypothetical protein